MRAFIRHSTAKDKAPKTGEYRDLTTEIDFYEEIHRMQIVTVDKPKRFFRNFPNQ